MKHCPKAKTPTAIGVNPETGELRCSKTGCGMWNCPYCSVIRKYFVARKCYLGIKHYQENGAPNWYFGTVTMHEKWRGFASIQNFKANWNKFYQKMRRVTDGPLYYCLLPEHHADSSMHVHILSNCPASTRWFKDMGRASGFGYKSENEALEDTSRAVSYVTKYVGKSLDVGQWPKDFRRIRFSIHWPEPPQRGDYAWQVVPANLARHVVRIKFEQGYNPINWMTGEQIPYEPHLRDTYRTRPLHDSTHERDTGCDFLL